MEKKRGLLLTILLLLSTLWYLSNFFVDTDNVYVLVISLIGLIILFGILKWKKIAVYGFFLLQVLAFLLKTSIGVTSRDVIVTFLDWALWFYAIYKDWKKFE